ncbi:MAG: potassium-transporting ATPase subunit KdpC [Candidatus Marinimicrobia bacterium]|nr:potassium-transporting ATPase subunit KdpC [Candidatus Neomarinimicrobiota bacterium]
MKNFLTALRLFLVMVILTGILYPLAVMAIAHFCFPHKADGSMMIVDGKVKGSELVGQKYVSGRYFWGRPSAIDYHPMPSGASNLGPTSMALREAVKQRRSQFAGTDTLSVPVDLLFASASGVDPHISPEAARLQIDRVVKARGFSTDQKEKLVNLVERSIEPPQWGIFGESRVNVFLLNLKLDRLN